VAEPPEVPSTGAAEIEPRWSWVVRPGIARLIHREQAILVVMPVERVHVDLYQIPVGAHGRVPDVRMLPNRPGTCTFAAILSGRIPCSDDCVSQFCERVDRWYVEAVVAIVTVDEDRTHSDAERPHYV
jgi:hypothetical protein